MQIVCRSSIVAALALIAVAAPTPTARYDLLAASMASAAAYPADAKPANLSFTLKDINNQNVKLFLISRDGQLCARYEGAKTKEAGTARHSGPFACYECGDDVTEQ